MQTKTKLSIINWSIFTALFLLFLLWHGAFEGPLKPHEIVNNIEAFTQKNPDTDIDKLRRFMEEDDGRPVIMVNVIKNYDTPIVVN